MRVLSVRQPWASLIVWGVKDVENRTWSTSYRGPLLIHAGAQFAPEEHWEMALDLATDLGVNIPEPMDLPRGCIIGMATLTDCVSEFDSPWWCGPVGWLLSDARVLTPLPARGQLGVWTPSPALCRQLRQHLPALGR